MKIKLLTFLLITIVTTASAQNTISLLGFGEISYQKNKDNYKLTIADLGTFDFQGTIKPLMLETQLSPQQLKNFPGYELMQALELEEISLKLHSDSLSLEAKANTQKKLKPLCETFNIEAPYINFIAQLNPKKIDLTGELDFSDSPILIEVSEETGTRFSLEKMKLTAQSELGKDSKLSLGVINNLNIKPTEYDPDLKTIMELSYNLLNAEISGTGSLKDTWSDPMGLSQHLKISKDAVSFSNAVVSIGWIPGSSAPTTVGFAVEEANFFNLSFETAMILSPIKGEIALEAHRDEMEIKDFIAILEDGFGLKVQDNMYPNDLLIYDIDLLFSLNGGKIGDYEIPKGFLYKGGVKLSEKMSGNVYFYTDSRDSLSLDMFVNTEELYEKLEAKIQKGVDSKLDKALKEALSSLEIKKIQLHLEADKNLHLVGATECQLVLFDQELNFSFNETFNPEKITNNIILKVGKTALEHLNKKRQK